MDAVQKGTWIINSAKHLGGVRQDAHELSYFEATDVAGKAGALLARLVATEKEALPADKVRAFARASRIGAAEFGPILDQLQRLGKVDLARNPDGTVRGVEVYSFSARDAIETTATVYEAANPSEHEEASIASLENTFRLPRLHADLVEHLTEAGFHEEVAEATVSLQDTLQLVRSSKLSEQTIYYNEYAFARDPAEVARALGSLKATDREVVEQIQDLVASRPGYPVDRLERRFSVTLLRTMEGIGLLDATTVSSDVGEAAFATLPQLKGASIQQPLISADVFHKAKLLLASLRFGEVKSFPSRGQIESREKMTNIVRKLVRGEWVGPCTAIGQDYQLLEVDGVVQTRPSGCDSTYYMRLRQTEVGLLVLQMLEFHQAVPEADVQLQRLLAKQPVQYNIPEQRRSDILARPVRPVLELRENLLQTLRTGRR